MVYEFETGFEVPQIPESQGGQEGRGPKGSEFRESWERVTLIVEKIFDENGEMLPDSQIQAMEPSPLDQLNAEGCDYIRAYNLRANKTEFLRYIKMNGKAEIVQPLNRGDIEEEISEKVTCTVKVPLHETTETIVKTHNSRLEIVRDDGVKPMGLKVRVYDISGAPILENQQFVEVDLKEGMTEIDVPGVPKIFLNSEKLKPGAETVDITVTQEQTDLRELNKSENPRAKD